MGGGNDLVFEEEIDDIDDELLLPHSVPMKEDDEQLSCSGEDVDHHRKPSSREENSSVESSSVTRTRLPTSLKFNPSTASSSPTSSSGSNGRKNIPERKISKKSIARARGELLNYRPGSFLGKKVEIFKLPEVTSLLVVGMRGSGKSAVVNRIIRVIDGEAANFCPAPLGKSPEQSGTNFLGEYSICRGNVSLFDTRGFIDSEVVEGMSKPEEWMTQGVRDGEMDLRSDDAMSLQKEVKLKGRHVNHMLTKRRDVNFVIFVVNAADFLARFEQGGVEGITKVKMLYENPYFSFRDDRPAVVVTHTDQLSDNDRVHVLAAIASHLKIPGINYIYDLSGTSDEFIGDKEVTNLRENVVQLLTSTLQRADRHLPFLADRHPHLPQRFGSYFHSDDIKFYLKIAALYLMLVGAIYLTVLLLRTHKSSKKWMKHANDGSTVTINLRWLGKTIRF
ncbi:hypothetical protein R1flu_025871 [Riccia fluitans]|uniref:Uncharacterized protein n=1 Tax=Riccia fluitans TaxID=41844 RepID=A0ABD1XYZ1_9MARC